MMFSWFYFTEVTSTISELEQQTQLDPSLSLLLVSFHTHELTNMKRLGAMTKPHHTMPVFPPLYCSYTW